MEREEIIQLIKETMRQELDQMISNDRFVFRRNVEFENDVKIITGERTGLKIGETSDQKISVFGVTPVVQGATISDPSGGVTVDGEARTAIEDLIDRLQDFGIIL